MPRRIQDAVLRIANRRGLGRDATTTSHPLLAQTTPRLSTAHLDAVKHLPPAEQIRVLRVACANGMTVDETALLASTVTVL